MFSFEIIHVFFTILRSRVDSLPIASSHPLAPTDAKGRQSILQTCAENGTLVLLSSTTLGNLTCAMRRMIGHLANGKWRCSCNNESFCFLRIAACPENWHGCLNACLPSPGELSRAINCNRSRCARHSMRRFAKWSAVRSRE
jgi:hypothetical protein